MLYANGQIKYGEKVVCNRIGLTPEITKHIGEDLVPNIENSFTVSKLARGTLLSFFAVDGIHDSAWFVESDLQPVSYFLSTSTKLDGYSSFWKSKPQFGTIMESLRDHTEVYGYAWTFFLSYDTHTYTLSTVWDIENQTFLLPIDWPKYFSQPAWVVEYYNPLFNQNVKQIEFKSPNSLNINFGYDKKINLVLGEPLLFTIYCGDKVKTLKIISKEDSLLSVINSRSKDKYEALLIAKFKNEDTTYFEKLKFTPFEITRFYIKFKSARSVFFKEINDKLISNAYVTFPTDLFKGIKLGFILSKARNLIDKDPQNCSVYVNAARDEAWGELTKCTKSWKILAVSAFYHHYMKIVDM